jgi:hypothetical protein
MFLHKVKEEKKIAEISFLDHRLFICIIKWEYKKNKSNLNSRKKVKSWM